MPLILGTDLGTTKVTAVAVDAESGEVVASATEATPENLTPANFVRAVLAGMARNYREAWDQITSVTGPSDSLPRLVGAGNGLRENSVLAAAVSEEFGLVPVFTRHREEAAFGAALTGAVAAGVFDSLESAGRLVGYLGGGDGGVVE